MGYIGKDPDLNAAVDTNELADGAVTTAKLQDLAVTSAKFGVSGAVSSSAQIATVISGSLGTNASVIRSLTAAVISGSFTTTSSSLASKVTTLEGTGTAQGVGTTNSPTFADVTATGTVTAQEFHTEFISASVLYDSGSTRFGDTTDDTHAFTGSLTTSGSSLKIDSAGGYSGSVTSTGSYGRVEATNYSGDGSSLTGVVTPSSTDTLTNKTFPIIKLTPTATALAPVGSAGCLYYDSDINSLMEYDTGWLKVSRTVWSSTAWTHTAAEQSWDVPAGVGTLVFTMWGAGGGGGKTGGMYGGAGGFTQGTVNISTSSSITLKIIVGGGGSRGTGSGNGGSTFGGAGGGYSGVFLTSHTHGNAILIAGGGGGGAFYTHGGCGGGLTGNAGNDGSYDSGDGGTQTQGGAGGTYGGNNGENGSALTGGAGATENATTGGGPSGGYGGGGDCGTNAWASGGGGGGYYGGGGGSNGAPTQGGGGSGYVGGVSGAATSATTTTAGTNGTAAPPDSLNTLYPNTNPGQGGVSSAGNHGYVHVRYS